MPYIQRDEDNNICGLFANKQSYATEFLEDDDADVIAHLDPVKQETLTADDLAKALKNAGVLNDTQLEAVKGK